MTLKEAQAQYELAKTTKHSYRNTARLLSRVVSFLGPSRRPHDVFRADVKSYVVYHRKHTPGDGPLRDSLTIARAFWNFMKERELVEFNPFSSFESLL